MATETRQARGYVFGPLEKRGVLAGLRLGQLAIIGGALVASLIAFSSLPSGVALPAALIILAGAVVISYVQFLGKGMDEWAPIIFSWLSGGAGKRQWFSTMPLLGNYEPEQDANRVDFGEDEKPGRKVKGAPKPAQKKKPKSKDEVEALPPSLQGLTILELPVGDNKSTNSIGVIKDERNGLYTGVLAVHGDAFALLEVEEKERRLQSWADVLGSLARPSSFVHRIQWIERAVPDDGDAFNRYLSEAKAQPDDAPTVRSYVDLIQEFGSATQQHETFIALQVSMTGAARVIRKAGGGDKGACLVLIRELRQLMEGLQSADIRVEGALSPRLLGLTFRNAVDPAGRRDATRRGRRDPKTAGVNPKTAFPLATETFWDHYKTERAYHATYWISEWPRLEVGPDFMAPLMVRTQRIRTVSMIMQPIDPAKAQREVESAHTAYVSDEDLRGRAGYMPSERRRRELDNVLRREQELADGFAEYRYAGYITVTASSEAELDEACGEVEQTAQQSRLELRRLWGEQDAAFTCTLPLCRGLN